MCLDSCITVESGILEQHEVSTMVFLAEWFVFRPVMLVPATTDFIINFCQCDWFRGAVSCTKVNTQPFYGWWLGKRESPEYTLLQVCNWQTSWKGLLDTCQDFLELPTSLAWMLLRQHWYFLLFHLFEFSYPSLLKIPRTTNLLEVDFTLKSPRQTLWCSSQPLVPICVLISHQMVCCSCCGDWSPRPPSFHSFWISTGSRTCVAWGLFPFPWDFNHFLAAASFSCEGANWTSLMMLYSLWRTFVRWRSMLHWKEENAHSHQLYAPKQRNVQVSGPALLEAVVPNFFSHRALHTTCTTCSGHYLFSSLCFLFFCCSTNCCISLNVFSPR